VRPSATVPSTKPPSVFTGAAAALASHAAPRKDNHNAVFVFMLHPPINWKYDCPQPYES
jgi:hypothetical protein